MFFCLTNRHQSRNTNKLLSMSSDISVFGQIRPVVVWSPDGTSIACGIWDSTVRVWRTEDGQAISVFLGHQDGHSGNVLAVAWSPDGCKIASGGFDETVRVWDATEGRELAALTGHEYSVHSVAWSPNGSKIASGSFDTTVRVWDAASGLALAVLSKGTACVESVAWSPDGSKLAYASGFTVRVWDAVCGTDLAALSGHKDKLYSVVWSMDGCKIASADEDKTVRVWDVASKRTVMVVPACRYSSDIDCVIAIGWNTDGLKLARACDDKTVHVWDVGSANANNTELLLEHSFDKTSVSVAWSTDGFGLAIASGNKLLVPLMPPWLRRRALLHGVVQCVSRHAESQDDSTTLLKDMRFCRTIGNLASSQHILGVGLFL